MDVMLDRNRDSDLHRNVDPASNQAADRDLHRVQACGPQVQRGHIGLDQAGGGDQVAGAGELDGGEINADDPQPVISQFAGRRQADTAAQHAGTAHGLRAAIEDAINGGNQD
jgi:hypothetical protein